MANPSLFPLRPDMGGKFLPSRGEVKILHILWQTFCGWAGWTKISIYIGHARRILIV